MTLQTFFLYLGTWSLVALTPGPAAMFSMAQAIRYGFRTSLAGISGIQLGNLLFFVAVALGLAALLATAGAALTALRVAGAIYLLYLGIRVIVRSFRPRSDHQAKALGFEASARSLFAQGLLIQLTNPKALLFVSALLPQFIDSRSAAAPQLLVLVAATLAIDYLVLSTYAYLAHKGVQSFHASPVGAWLERAYGAALGLIGLRLLVGRK